MNATAEHYAKEAARLLSDEVLAGAMATVRMNALLALAETDPDDKTEILRQQAIAKCLSDVRDALHAAILATGQNDGGVSVNGPTA